MSLIAEQVRFDVAKTKKIVKNQEKQREMLQVRLMIFFAH
jgi:hypothetical protein